MRLSAVAFVALIVFAMLSVGCWLESGRGPGDKPKGTDSVGATPALPQTSPETGADAATAASAHSSTTATPVAQPVQTAPVN